MGKRKKRGNAVPLEPEVIEFAPIPWEPDPQDWEPIDWADLDDWPALDPDDWADFALEDWEPLTLDVWADTFEPLGENVNKIVSKPR